MDKYSNHLLFSLMNFRQVYNLHEIIFGKIPNSVFPLPLDDDGDGFSLDYDVCLDLEATISMLCNWHNIMCIHVCITPFLFYGCYMFSSI